MEMINQPFNGQLGTQIMGLLSSGNYRKLNIVVAFAKNSGVLRLKKAFEQFRKRGGEINVYVGVDLDGTSYEALNNLLGCTDSLRVIHVEGGQTFHSKIYDFIGPDQGNVIVGSNNLTGGGLWTNFETAVMIPTRAGHGEGYVRLPLERYLENLQEIDGISMSIKTQKDIDRLLEGGYVQRELKQILNETRKRSQISVKPKMFGASVPAKIPGVESEILHYISPVEHSLEFYSNKSRLAASETDPTMWIETRKLTGGSRNIIDLSKKSRIATGDPKGTIYEHSDKGFMRGTVEFFGVDPADTNSTKDVTVNFEGTDYVGNKILYPDGEKANGTWRIQIKGVDSNGSTVLNALARRGMPMSLKHKVIAFTRIGKDYYSMSVFPDAELPAILEKTDLTGYNGQTSLAKRIGYF